MLGLQLNPTEDSELLKVSLKDSKLLLNVDKYFLTNRVDNNLPINNDTLTNLQEKIWYVVKPNPINNNNASTYSNKCFVLNNNAINIINFTFL